MRALASCRRVVLLLLFFFTAGIGWIYWNAPNINTIRPTIERYLQQDLELDQLKLGDISWYWAGFLWIEIDQLDFNSSKHGIAFHAGTASIRIPLQNLFTGDITPDKIQLTHGTLDVVLDDSTPPILPHYFVLNDTQVHWLYSDMQGSFSHVTLSADAFKRTLKASSSELQLSANWDKNWLPEHITLHCKHIDWLPKIARQYIQGTPQADLVVTRTAPLQWTLKGSIDSPIPIAIGLPQSQYHYQLNHASTDLLIQLNHLPTQHTTNDSNQTQQTNMIKHIDIRALQWALAEHKIDAQGQWTEGELQLTATSPQLPMPLVWPVLKPFGDKQFQRWQTRMHHGVSKDIHAEIALAWPNPLQTWPSIEAWHNVQFTLQAELDDMDIALGMSNTMLTHVSGHINITQDMLIAQISDALLPNKLGHAKAELQLPWDSLDLHVTGSSSTNIKYLLSWLDAPNTSNWTWHNGNSNSKTNSHFEFTWNTMQDTPKKAQVSFQPVDRWDITAFNLPLQFSQGKVLWNQDTGIALNNMHFSSPHMQGTLSLQAKLIKKTWKITQLQAQGSSELAVLAAHFQLPIAHANGNISSSLYYDNGWSGNVDLQHASWEHFLGSNKKAGDAFALHYQGTLDLNGKHPAIHINKITTNGKHISLAHGSASINQDKLELHINGLSTPSFKGDLDIDIPFADKEAWNMDVQASYLNRNALPDSLDHPESMIDKTWILRANIDRFDWNNAQISGVHIKLASDSNSIGIMQAAQIHTPEMDILDVDARFTLPGQGQIELRKLSASFEQQELTMSATLRPEHDGGMRWKGFAELHGNFGHLMNKSGLSDLFVDGDAHLLFSGQGLILKAQPWWQGMDGRLRLRVDQGRILEGGTLTTLLSVINLSRLPALLFGQRKDLSGPGILYERLQMEAIMQNQDIHIRNIVMRSSAFDLIGQGNLDIEHDMIDMYLLAKPLQNLDALLAKIPLLRDIIGGRSHSFLRKIYHLSGPFANAKVKPISAKKAGFVEPGIFDRLFSTPDNWFGSGKETGQKPPR